MRPMPWPPMQRTRHRASVLYESLPRPVHNGFHSRRRWELLTDQYTGGALGAAAVRLLAGFLVPSTNVEDERLGEIADRLKAKAAETGQEALSRGQQVAHDVVHSATQTAQESGSQHAAELSDSGQEKASAATAEARPGLQR